MPKLQLSLQACCHCVPPVAFTSFIYTKVNIFNIQDKKIE